VLCKTQLTEKRRRIDDLSLVLPEVVELHDGQIRGRMMYVRGEEVRGDERRDEMRRG
jgi:hypothetical protein